MAASPPRQAAAPSLHKTEAATRSPQGKRVVAVHLPVDDVLADPYLDDDERVKLLAKRKEEERHYWYTHIGPRVDSQVDDALKEHHRLQRQIMPETDPPYKCVVCTLPGGTCGHSPPWIMNAYSSRLEDPVERELRLLTDVTSDDNILTLEGRNNEPVASYMRRLQWMVPVVHLNDRLNGHPADFSSPPPLAGHSCLFLGHKLFLFCGLAYTTRDRCMTFHPYASHLSNHTDHGEESSHVYTFNFVELVWNRAITGGAPPCPRIGQLALVLDHKRVFIFGGRDARGQSLNDAYIFDAWEYRWERLPEPLPQPPPRHAMGGAVVDGKVLMFGGRDRAGRVLGDLWQWDPYRRLWSTPLTVGVPPAARYGHAMMAVSGGRVAVMGGCGVGPQQEDCHTPEDEKADLELRVAARSLSQSYYLQEEEARIAGTRLATQANFLDHKDLARAAGHASSAIAAREFLTQEAESHVMHLAKHGAIRQYWSHLTGQHGLPHMDIIMLATVNGAFTWSIPSFPPPSGHIPSARMHFMAQYIPMTESILVWGGCAPTSRHISHMDHHVYSLNLQNMRWTKPVMVDSKETMDAPIEAAATAVRMSRRYLESARATAHLQGVPEGKTLSVAHAEATLEVHTWRLTKLKEEKERLLNPPTPRFGAACLLYGGRVYIYGGWGEHMAFDEFLCLDLEQPDERERRLRDELAIRLERQRAKQEVQQLIEIKRAWYEELCRKHAQEQKEESERRLMAYEDLLSSIPPKTKGPAPKIKCANAHTVWVEWDAPKLDCRDRPLGPGAVEYLLSMKGGHIPLHEGMEVVAEVKRGDKPYEKPRLEQGTVVSSYPLAHATITRDWHDGTFDIVYKADGYQEAKVRRPRLRPAKEPEWEPVYRGKETKTGITGLVPDYILENEPGYEVICCFGLQAYGTDFPPEEPSLMSSVAVCFTHNPADKGRGPGRMLHKEVREVESITLVSWDNKCWSEGIGNYYY